MPYYKYCRHAHCIEIHRPRSNFPMHLASCGYVLSTESSVVRVVVFNHLLCSTTTEHTITSCVTLLNSRIRERNLPSHIAFKYNTNKFGLIPDGWTHLLLSETVGGQRVLRVVYVTTDNIIRCTPFARRLNRNLHGGQELHVERAAMARMGFLDKAEELDVMIEAERTRLKKVIQRAHNVSTYIYPETFLARK